MPKLLLQNLIVKTLDQLKTIDIVLIDVRKKTTITDFMVIGSGKSSRQLTATADNLLDVLRKKEIKPLRVQGLKDTGWVLIDFGGVLVHLMSPETRTLYALEHLWK